ncbi:MAG: DNA adenine methylase [Oscillospiraceae bacterium]|nr:DNA adenine methylase [Oscillospiraceae bacterium]
MPNSLVKPYLKWAGGKRQLLPEIKKHLPKNFNSCKYYEPFVGAGAVFFEKQPKKAVINDYNTQLMLTYRVIRDNIDDLIEALRVHGQNNNEEYYYEIRSKDRNVEAFNALSNTEKAARLIFLNKTCYNGLYRVNSQGLFNAPYGRYINPAICDEPVLKAVHKYLSDNGEVEILNGDFAEAVQTANGKAFVYFDPPYHSADNTNFTGYQADRFGTEEQTRLRDTYVELTERGAKCLLSNSDTEFIRGLYTDDRFEIITVTAKRAINSDAAGRGNVNELLIRNWK